jgi:hypothetical protein
VVSAVPVGSAVRVVSVEIDRAAALVEIDRQIGPAAAIWPPTVPPPGP